MSKTLDWLGRLVMARRIVGAPRPAPLEPAATLPKGSADRFPLSASKQFGPTAGITIAYSFVVSKLVAPPAMTGFLVLPGFINDSLGRTIRSPRPL